MPEPTTSASDGESIVNAAAADQSGAKFADVYVIATGRKQIIPVHWLDDPILSRPFRKTPLSEKQQRDADATLAKANTETPAAGDEKE